VAAHVGMLHAVSQPSMAKALKGLVWNMQLEDKWYEVEFTGDLSTDGDILVKLNKPTKAPGGHHV
jgi:hypothetical protein